MNVLMIGNSFTYYFDVPALLEQICRSAGKDVNVESVTKGGWTLLQHADKDDEAGRIVEEKLASEKRYDVVILQEQSSRPFENYLLFRDGCVKLAKKIRANNPDARIILYQTWGYGDEFAYMTEKGWTCETMFAKLEKAYAEAAKELGAEVSPVGKGLLALYRQTAIDPYWEDRKHQSYHGSFLSATIHARKLFPDLQTGEIAFRGECTEDDAKQIFTIAEACGE